MQVIEQTPALADHHQQATAGAVVFVVALQMFGKVVDALRQERNLHVGGSGIFFVQLELINGLGFGFHTNFFLKNRDDSLGRAGRGVKHFNEEI